MQASRFKKGENPRLVLGHHRERGPKRFEYTLLDLAELYGVSKRTVHRWQAAGFNPARLKDICERYREVMP